MYGSFDRTFCTGDRCARRQKCDRWTENLKRWVARRGIDMEGRPISVAAFADHDGNCEQFSPTEQETGNREQSSGAAP